MKLLFVLLSALASVNAFAETKAVNFAQMSCGGGQLCSPPYSVQVSTGGTLGAYYAVRSSHCSSVRVSFLVDGKTLATSGWLGWNGAKGSFASLPKNTGEVNLGPVSSGKHTLGIQAEGQKGGCNHGTLSSWGGLLTITTSDANAPKTYACQVIVDKVVKQTTQATDRNDCYKQIGFGSENCSIYGKKGFFPDPDHQYFLDQVFNGTDRVTSEFCPKVISANCEAKVDGKVVKAVTAKDRDDCYRQIAFGSENCKVYDQFIPKDGKKHFLDQVFKKTDRVTSEYCPK